MRRLIAILTLLVAMPAGANDSCAESHPHWASDFAAFMRLMDCASTELTEARDRSAYLDQFTRRLAGVTVRWTGTVRRVRGERLYFNESFAEVEPGTRAARVMYYAAPGYSEDWRGIPGGETVAYTGKITDVKVDTLGATKPLLFIDLQVLGRVEAHR